MYVVELEFGEEPARLAARPAHRRRLRSLHADGTLVTAGPFADDSGALLIFDVPDSGALHRLLEEDPYYRTPGVTVTRCRPWTPITG